MKKRNWAKITGIILGSFVVIAASIIFYIVWFMPDIPAPVIQAGSSPERIARGKYLANHVTVCMDCHSTRDWSRFSGPLVPGTEGKGGEIFDEKMGFPGHFRSPNITPFNLGNWSDGEIYRAITSGVNKDGIPLFPIMPYHAYGTLDTEDILSIIAYIRSIPPINNTPPRSTPTFPMNIILHLMPAMPSPGQRPAPGDTVSTGEYLVRASGCIECHTPAEHGQIVKSKAFTGGREFQMPDGSLLMSANITPDPETGIGKMNRDAFLFRFKSYDPATYNAPVLKPGERQSIMPWTMYAGMDSTDLKAIYAYLFSLKPVNHKVK